ncbi:MAG: insulinase family protein, partial [bacterium]|nr:insulinase family protein [bacterium]
MKTRQYPHLPVPVMETVLPNGLTLITAETPSQFVHVSIVFAVGSLDDGANPGISHFLEHLLYDGAAVDGVHPKLRHLHGKGIEVNAETGKTSTEYWIDGYVRDLGAIIDALFSIASVFECSAFHVDRERPVILQELDDRDGPDQDLLLWERRTFFPHVPALHYPTGGTRESVEWITVGALADFHKRFYQPANAAVIVTGGVSHDAV